MSTSTTLASRDSSGNAAIAAVDPSVSAAGNLAAYAIFDTSVGLQEIFVRDITGASNTPTLVSRSTAGAKANATSFSPGISADGSAVVFDSNASNLATVTTNGREQVYEFNRAAGTTSLVSQTGGAAGTGGDSFGAAVSSDGSIVAYTSNATNLNGGGANFQAVQSNLGTLTKTILSTATGSAVVADRAAIVDGISDTAHDRVAFESAADNLGFANAANGTQIFVKDVVSGALILASTTDGSTVASGAGGAAAQSTSASISANGQFVAFQSNATNLGGGATGTNNEIYYTDLNTHATKLLSKSITGGAADGTSTNAVMSADGQYVAFTSTADNLVSGVTGTQTYVVNVATGFVSLLSQDASGTAGNGKSVTGAASRFTGATGSSGQVFSADDKTAVYTSNAGSLTNVPSATTEILAAVSTTPPSAAADTTAPTVTGLTVSQPTGAVTSNTSVTLTATATDNVGVAGVEFYEGSVDLGPGTLSADGTTYTRTVTLPEGVASGFGAKAKDAAGNMSTLFVSPVSFTVDRTSPLASFDATPKVVNARTINLTGTYTDNNGAGNVTNIEVYEGKTDLGKATLNNGVWSFTHTFTPGDHGFFTALATDAAGNVSPTAAGNYDFSTGRADGSTKATVDTYSNVGDYTGTTQYNKNGSVYLQLKASVLPNGNFRNAYVAGSELRGEGLSSLVDVLSKNGGDLVSETQNVLQGGGHTLTGQGQLDTFVFTPSFGQDTITNFSTSNANHDVLSLPSSEFSSFAQVLQNASQSGADTIIKAGNGDAVTLKNVAVSALQSQDFKFHA